MHRSRVKFPWFDEIKNLPAHSGVSRILELRREWGQKYGLVL